MKKYVIKKFEGEYMNREWHFKGIQKRKRDGWEYLSTEYDVDESINDADRILRSRAMRIRFPGVFSTVFPSRKKQESYEKMTGKPATVENLKIHTLQRFLEKKANL